MGTFIPAYKHIVSSVHIYSELASKVFCIYTLQTVETVFFQTGEKIFSEETARYKAHPIMFYLSKKHVKNVVCLKHFTAVFM